MDEHLHRVADVLSALAVFKPEPLSFRVPQPFPQDGLERLRALQEIRRGLLGPFAELIGHPVVGIAATVEIGHHVVVGVTASEFEMAVRRAVVDQAHRLGEVVAPQGVMQDPVQNGFACDRILKKEIGRASCRERV